MNLPVGGMLPSRKEVERCHLIFSAWWNGITTGVGTSLGHFDDKVHPGRTRQVPKKNSLFLFKESKHITCFQITSMRVRPEEVSRRLRIPELLSSEPVVP